MIRMLPMPTTIAIILCWLALIASAMAKEPSRLVPGPVLAPAFVPSGWIADHLQDYTEKRRAYTDVCRTPAVLDELQYLTKQVDHEQELSNVARARLQDVVVEGDTSAKRRTAVAVDALALIDNDITAIDSLFVRLSALPDCDDAITASPAPPKQPSSQSAVTSLAAPPTKLPPPATPAEQAPTASPAPPATTSDDGASPPRQSDLFVVRFDKKLTGLMPNSIRTLTAALKAFGEGRKVQIAIEGCEAGENVAENVDCAERIRRLKRILRDDGVVHPADLIATEH